MHDGQVHAFNYLTRLRRLWWIVAGLAVLLLAGLLIEPAAAQHIPVSAPPLPKEPLRGDTTFVFSYQATLDSVVVTASGVPRAVQRARRTLSQANPLHRLIDRSELSTSVSGQTGDLHRDLPAMVRIYTPQGIPLLTKYTSNNALTTTIPDHAARLELREPGARYPNPDAPVVLQPDYTPRRSAALTPFKQTAGVATAYQDRFEGAVSLERSAPPGMLERLIPELAAYSTTYAGFAAGRVRTHDLQIEVMGHGSYSDNEFGNLLGVEHLEEVDTNAYGVANASYSLDNTLSLQAGVGVQYGDANKYVEEYGTRYREIHQVLMVSYTAAVRWERLTARGYYHILHRDYPQTRARQDRLESLLAYRLDLGPQAAGLVEARYDVRDREPSLSAHLQWQPDRPLSVSLDAARVYDPLGPEALGSTIREVQRLPHPWTTTYGRLGARYQTGPMEVYASVIYKHLELGWYEATAATQGWIPRVGLSGRLPGPRYIGWRVEGVARALTLEVAGEPGSRTMPGAARFQGHAAVELGAGPMHYMLKVDTFIDREQLVRSGRTAAMGTQVFLTVGATRSMGPVQVGLRVDNTLGLFGYNNKMIAWYDEHDGGMNMASAPPLPSLSVSVEL